MPIKIVEITIETKDIKNSVVNHSFERVKILEKESYLEIYNNLLELSIYAKRLPKSYNKLSEEENRDQLINALNLKLKTATASGETFNVKGKSDIIIVDNKVIYYIVECKIWNGASKFNDAIDQLLSYISEDIFYSSLIIFNKNISSIVDIAVDRIKEHKEYIEEESKNRYLFKHPKNEKEKLEISLIVFDVYYE